MSDLRRARQAERYMPAFTTRIISVLRKHWKWFLALIGVPSGLGDLIREFARAKSMDWIYEHIGFLGIWLISYKLALVTLGVIAVIVWITVAVIREAHIGTESIIVNHKGEPYRTHTISKRQAAGLAVASLAAVSLLTCGTYYFYRVTPQALLERYPLGYVIFKADYSNAVFPYKTQSLLDRYEFNWQGAAVVENTSDMIIVRMPNIRDKTGHFLATDLYVGGPKKVGSIFNGGAIYSDGNISISGEILSINRGGVVFVIGFESVARNR